MQQEGEEGEDAQQMRVLLSLYLLLLRRKNGRGKPKEEALQRVQLEARRRRLLRRFHLVRQRRLLLLLMMAQRWQRGSTSKISTWSNHDWWENVALGQFGLQDWLENFRMSKDTFLHICNQLRAKLCGKKTHMTPEKKLAVTLWRLASNTECHVVASLFGLRPLMVVRCMREVCQAIISLLKPLYLRLPNNHELKDMARIFSTQWSFPHCVGALGTIHVGVVPPNDCSTTYQNSQQWHSTVLQAAVDGFGQFWEICADFPGGMDNNEILENSYLWILAREGGFLSKPAQLFSGRTMKYVLLGDVTLPLHDWLLKPYLNGESLTQPQMLFNLHLERAHVVLEKAFVRLRARWQCLLSPHNLTLVPTMVMACCILHNVCEMHTSPFNNSWFKAVEMSQFTQPHHPPSPSLVDSGAEEVRSLFCSYFQNPQGS